jgi:hypothetical protein
VSHAPCALQPIRGALPVLAPVAPPSLGNKERLKGFIEVVARKTVSLPQDGSLPAPLNDQGARRKLGVEIEFGGLSEEDAAKVFARAIKGACSKSGKGWQVNSDMLGTCDFYLDTKFRETIEDAGGEAGLETARLLIPVELVTTPFDPADLPMLNAAIEALRAAGALGSRKRLTNGFGVHLNVEVERLQADHVAPVLCAYALLEVLLREKIGLDLSRRALPFVDPYPETLVDVMSVEMPDSMEALAEVYLAHTTSRNHGLDLLPLLAEAAPEIVRNAVPADTKISARPAYHFRLPESRIDEEGWNLNAAWKLWVHLERVATDPELLDALRQARRQWSVAPRLTRGPWVDRVRDCLDTAEKAYPA